MSTNTSLIAPAPPFFHHCHRSSILVPPHLSLNGSRSRPWNAHLVSRTPRAGSRVNGRSREVRTSIRAQRRGDPGAGDDESKAVLDAFFLGKAFAEALSERLGSAIGEFLSDVGRWQAEQQKNTRDFQEEVQERARVAKLKAARETLGTEQAREQKSMSYNGVSTFSDASSDDSSMTSVKSERPTTSIQDSKDF